MNLGAAGENIAAKFLSNKGYKIIEKNYQNTSGYRLGEIDIIARDPKTAELIFVEVKTRKNVPGNVILPEEKITNSKLKKLSRIAEVYVKVNGLYSVDFRFDAVAIIIDEDGMKAKIRHIKRL